MGIFDGLEKFGLGGLSKESLYDDGKKAEKKETAKTTVAMEDMKEEDFLLERRMECPVCDHKFVSKGVKSTIRRLGADRDLRPKHLGIDTIKYDVTSCPKCGYTAMSRFFPRISTLQRKLLKEKVMANFKSTEEALPEKYSYEYALEKYKLSLFCTVVKMGKMSEKAYTCLKMSWLCRGQAEEWKDQGISEDSEAYKKMKADEMEYYEQAYEGLNKAVSSENFPICGMDQNTVDILLAEMAFALGKYDVTSKLVSRLLTSQTVKGSIKDKAFDLKEEVVAAIAKAKQS